MSDGPLVSVVITTWNRSRFIRDAIDSALAQTFRDFEIILLDDGSTDDTAEKVGDYGPPVRYFFQENVGMAAARNRALAHATGKYAAFLDSDDIWLPGKLEADVAILEADRDVGLVCSLMEVIDPDGRRTGIRKPLYDPGVTFRDALRNGGALTSTFTCRRDLLMEFGGFDEGLSRYDDLNVLLEFTLRGQVVCRDGIDTLFRDHAGNISKDRPAAETARYELYRKWLGRCPDRTSRRVCRKKLKKFSRLLYRRSLKEGDLLRSARYLATFLRSKLPM